MSDRPGYDVLHQTSSGFVAMGQTDVGRVRGTNEDALLIIPEPPKLLSVQIVAAVADGMGGHVGGAIASSTAVDVIEQYICDLPESDDLPSSLGGILEQSIKEAQQAIQSKAALKDLHGMGTTITALMVGATSAVIANVGDSRAYILRNGTLEQVTEDHSLVAEQVREGLLPRESIEAHPLRNVLTRALGIGTELIVDIFQLSMQPGDVIMLCSDGLYPVVAHAEILGALTGKSPKDACDHLIAMANARGGPDNITVVVVQVPDG